MTELVLVYFCIFFCFLLILFSIGFGIVIIKTHDCLLDILFGILLLLVGGTGISIGIVANIEGNNPYHVTLKDNENNIIKDTIYTYKDYIIRENGCITFKKDPKKYYGYSLEEIKVEDYDD